MIEVEEISEWYKNSSTTIIDSDFNLPHILFQAFILEGLYELGELLLDVDDYIELAILSLHLHAGFNFLLILI